MRRAFGPSNQVSWTLYKQDGSVEKVYSAGTSQLVFAMKSSQDGKAYLELPDGRSISIQPDGRIETRSNGTDGGYEQCVLSGSVAAFLPTDTPFWFAVVPV